MRLPATAAALLLAVCGTADAMTGRAAVFLVHPVCQGTGEKTTLGDVIVAAPGTAVDAGLMLREIPARYLSDGYIDRREILDVLGDDLAGPVIISGSAACRSHAPSVTAGEGKNADAGAGQVLVAPGDRVTYRAVAPGISIETRGTARAVGRRGERVEVHLDTGRSLRGVVTGKGEVVSAP